MIPKASIRSLRARALQYLTLHHLYGAICALGACWLLTECYGGCTRRNWFEAEVDAARLLGTEVCCNPNSGPWGSAAGYVCIPQSGLTWRIVVCQPDKPCEVVER